jgi:two-component system cell cycle sensor histidine kinase/response regulator CckA
VSKRSQTILVVDADSSHRESLRRALRAEGYRVLEALDYGGAENIQQQHRGQVDLLVTAISLPGGNGYELARSLVNIEPELKVLYVSGETGAKMSRYYIAACSELNRLTRPFKLTDLLHRIKFILESSSIAAETS